MTDAETIAALDSVSLVIEHLLGPQFKIANRNSQWMELECPFVYPDNKQHYRIFITPANSAMFELTDEAETFTRYCKSNELDEDEGLPEEVREQWDRACLYLQCMRSIDNYLSINTGLGLLGDSVFRLCQCIVHIMALEVVWVSDDFPNPQEQQIGGIDGNLG